MHVVVPAGALTERDGFRPCLISYRADLCRNLGERLFPRYAFPFSGAPLALSPQGRLEPLRVVRDVRREDALGAHPALVHWRRRIALDLDDLAVLHMDEHSATAVADPAYALYNRDAVVHILSPDGPPERSCADRHGAQKQQRRGKGRYKRVLKKRNLEEREGSQEKEGQSGC